MKSKIILFILITILQVSCCWKVPEPVAAVNIVYTNLNRNENLFIVRSAENDFSLIIDTIRGALHEYNKYTVSINFKEKDYNYIIFVENTSYSDTITDVNYEIEERRCKTKLINFEYKWNGVKRTDREIIVE